MFDSFARMACRQLMCTIFRDSIISVVRCCLLIVDQWMSGWAWSKLWTIWAGQLQELNKMDLLITLLMISGKQLVSIMIYRTNIEHLKNSNKTWKLSLWWNVLKWNYNTFVVKRSRIIVRMIKRSLSVGLRHFSIQEIYKILFAILNKQELNKFIRSHNGVTFWFEWWNFKIFNF